MEWYLYALAALVLLGGQRFLYKVAAERGRHTGWTMLVFMGSVALLAFTALLWAERPFRNWRFLFLISLVNSISFWLATVCHIEALKCVPAGVAYPIIRLNTILVVVFSMLFWGDRLSGLQVVGILSALGAVVLLTLEPQALRRPLVQRRRGLMLIGVAVLGGAAAAVSSKWAALGVNKLAFIGVSYSMSALLSLFSLPGGHGPPATRAELQGVLAVGGGMGLLNLAGYYCFLQAVAQGPLSIVVSLVGLHFGVAVGLAVIVYKERLGFWRVSGILLTVLSVLLLRK